MESFDLLSHLDMRSMHEYYYVFSITQFYPYCLLLWKQRIAFSLVSAVFGINSINADCCVQHGELGYKYKRKILVVSFDGNRIVGIRLRI